MPYRDDPGDENGHNDNDDDDDEEEYPPRPGRRGRGRRNNRNYQSVQVDDDDADFEDAVDRRLRQRRELSNDRTRSCMACMWLCLMSLLIIAVGGLMLFRYEKQVHPEYTIFGGNESLALFGGFFDNADDDDDDDNYHYTGGGNHDKHKPTDSATAAAAKSSMTPAIPIPSSKDSTTIHYDPAAALQFSNPFDFKGGDWYGSVAVPPPPNAAATAADASSKSSPQDRLGFFQHPHMVGPHLVFVSEGDLYYTLWNSDATKPTAAMKLTTTVGNVQTPMLHPDYPYMVAFTATYTAHREVYLMDLRPSHRSQPAMRLTYWDTHSGISSIVGWKGTSLVFSAMSRDVGLPDRRLYELTLSHLVEEEHDETPEEHEGHGQVLAIAPIPLSQAIDAAFSDDCMFFTRFSQSSNTNRYVGGTAESLWAHCEGEDRAVPLAPNYKGTMKSPRIGSMAGFAGLFFLADWDTQTMTTPTTMNLFAAALPTKEQLYSGTGGGGNLLVGINALTTSSCDNDGLAIQEYSVSSGDDTAVLRIGADLYHLNMKAGSTKPTLLNIVIYSDFHEHQERILPVRVPHDMVSVDVYDTAFGTTAALLGMRGQVFSAPVSSSSQDTSYAGAGMNLPPRRYKVAPGTTVGGMVRILSATVVPMPQEVDQSTRRLAVLQATSVGETAEHGFYLVEVQSDAPTGFVSRDELPTPFLVGGTVKDVTVSPCGRRMAWTDLDGHICVMTMPMYQGNNATTDSDTSTTDDASYQVLPAENTNSQPLLGIDVELNFSPGGRYLAISHTARNQFQIISICDLSDANRDGVMDVADIILGDCVQATPDRFNSYSPYWGKTAMDFGTYATTATIATLQGDTPPPNDAATTLYYLSDRDVISDVASPWGTRAPSPHFPDSASLYALPLISTAESDDFPMHGIYAGGGAAELWADGMMELQQHVKELMAAAPPGVGGGGAADRRLNNNHYMAAAAAARQHSGGRRRRLEDGLAGLGDDTGGGGTYPGGGGGGGISPGGGNPGDDAGDPTGLDANDLDIIQQTLGGQSEPSVAPNEEDNASSPTFGETVSNSVPGTDLPTAAGTDLPYSAESDSTDLPTAYSAIIDNESPAFEVAQPPVPSVPAENEPASPVAASGSNATTTAPPVADGAAPVAATDEAAPVASAGNATTDTAPPEVATGDAAPVASTGNATTTAPPVAAPTTSNAGPTVGASTTTTETNGTRPSAPPVAAASNKTTTTTTTSPPVSAPTDPPTMAPTRKATSRPTSNPTAAPSIAMSEAPSSAPSEAEPSPVFPNDREIDFGAGFSRKAYRVAGVPAGNYKSIVCQLQDDPSMVLVETTDKGTAAKFFAFEDFPSDYVEPTPIHPDLTFAGSGVSTSRDHLILIFSPGVMTVVPNTAASVMKMLTDKDLETNIVDTDDMSISVWPALEYEQMFNDAWRMLRDYFYDTNMNGVDWPLMHTRYKGLVKRCTKREELDNVLAQMAAELSALHVFVYGGEYNSPFGGDSTLIKAHAVASLGATFERSVEFKGYVIKSIAHRDPDFNLLDGSAIYSPLSHQVLSLSGQEGLRVGDVIVGINGESVMRVPDMHMLLRGTAGRSVRLDVIRQPQVRRRSRRQLENATSTEEGDMAATDETTGAFTPTPVITVPISQKEADNLRYDAWEYKTRQMAQKLASDRGFTAGYLHLRSMEGPEDVDAFVRGFFPDYDKQALIIDVRHNRGGNIDSWLLDILQRKAWMFWQGRATNTRNGGLGWDQQFAFRGHVVVLIDEKSSSDAEGFARGVSELGLGKLVGTRTWGGGIWLSSDNKLVDGGIATAPEIGTYNDHFGWGLGIEQQGVEPDVVVDNNPRIAFDGTRDEQLEKAMDVLKQWLEDEPIVVPQPPGAKKDMSLKKDVENCPAGQR